MKMKKADYKIIHYNYIKYVVRWKRSREISKKLNFYTKEPGLYFMLLSSVLYN